MSYGEVYKKTWWGNKPEENTNGKKPMNSIKSLIKTLFFKNG
jgi:hypothetical protein